MSRTISKRAVTFAASTALVLLCGAGAVLVQRYSSELVASDVCRPPADQDTYIAAVLTDPVMRPRTYGLQPPASASPSAIGQPYVRRYCDLVGVDHLSPAESIDVAVAFTVPDGRGWYPLPILFDHLQPTLTGLGWTYAGYRDDESTAALNFCKTILGHASVVDLIVTWARQPTTLQIHINQRRARCPDPPTGGAHVNHATARPTSVASPTGSGRDQGPVRRRWTFNADAPLGSTTVARDGVVYTATGRWNTDNYVYALDATTGRQRWRTRVPGAVDGRMAVDNGQLYLGSSLGWILALDAGTGVEHWRSLIPYGRRTGDPGSALDVGDGAVYTAALDGRLYALEQATGAVRWRSTPDLVPHDRYGWSSPVYTERAVYIIDGHQTLYALDSRTGTTRWRAVPGGGATGALSAIRSTVYAGAADNQMYALDATRGTVRWTTPSGYAVLDAPTVPGGLLAMGGPALARAVDHDTGAVRWQTRGYPVTSGHQPTSLVFVTDRDARLYALDTATGAATWIADLGQFVVGLPIVDAGVVCLAADYGAGSSGDLQAGTLVAFDASPGD